MGIFLEYCKKQQQKQRNIIFGIFVLLSIILYLLWGPKVINYMRGAEAFKTIDFHTYDDNQAFFSLTNLENRYANESMSWISPGFADQVKNLETVGIYYLYMLSENQFMVVYADKGSMEDTERLYYNNISDDMKAISIDMHGGFEVLDDEVKTFAFDYLHQVNPDTYHSLETIEDVLLPYVFVSNRMGGTSIFFIKIAFYIFIALLILVPVLLLIDYKFIALKPTIKNISKLNEEDQKLIDKEYKESKKNQHFFIGKNLIFYRHFMQYRIINYKDIVWMYKKKSKLDPFNLYCVWVYVKDGSRYRFVLGSDADRATKLSETIRGHNKDMLFGFQAQLIDKYNISKEEFIKLINEMKDKGDKTDEKV